MAAVLTFSACDEEETKISNEQKQQVDDQATSEAYFNEAGDLSTKAMASPNESQIRGGRTKAGPVSVTVTGDTRFAGATVTLEVGPNSTIQVPQGTITIDFGTGKTDPNGVVRKGKIVVGYNGWRFLPQSKIEVTFNGYEVNGIKLEGKRTITTTAVGQGSITFLVEDDNGKATFKDGSSITRESTHTSKWTIGTNAATTTWTIEGIATGVTRDNQTYTVTIQSPIIFKLECTLNKFFAPAQGKWVLTVGTQVIEVDYGTGACDNLATVKVGGFSQEVTLGE